MGSTAVTLSSPIEASCENSSMVGVGRTASKTTENQSLQQTKINNLARICKPVVAVDVKLCCNMLQPLC